MEDKHFAWDEICDGLILLGSTQKPEDEQIKRHKQGSDPVHQSEVYCPHTYLILNFHESLSQHEQLRFRRQYLRKRSPNEPNVIILQDVKDLAMFLLATPVSPQFVKFFHLPIVDRFLRAVILYFQYYVTTWEELMNERAATMQKAPNPLAQGYRYRYAEEMQNLRCILGREYADLILGCQDNIQYHHITGGKKESPSFMESQGEKDLRMFEVLINMTHRVVWIALQRKYFNLIEIELHRLLRTKSYNIAERRSASQIVENMLTNDIKILHGQKIQEKRKLLRNSPVIQELIHSSCDYRLLSLGIGAESNDEKILYLQNALLVEEHKLCELGIKVGILGENRANYDILLMPYEDKKPDEIHLSDKGKFEKKSTKDTRLDIDKTIQLNRLPVFQTKFKLDQEFPIKEVDIFPKDCYSTVREGARKKWYLREVKRQHMNNVDTYSIATTLD